MVMQYVSIYVFEGADHEFDTKFGLTPSHNIYGQKIARAGCAPLFGGAGSPSNTKSPGPRPTSILSGILIHPAVWPQRTWTANWGLCHFWRGNAGSPSNTMWPGPRPTTTPSFILIHPTVWPNTPTSQVGAKKRGLTHFSHF